MARDLANRKYAARIVPAKKGRGAIYNRQAMKSRGTILRDFSLSKKIIQISSCHIRESLLYKNQRRGNHSSQMQENRYDHQISNWP